LQPILRTCKLPGSWIRIEFFEKLEEKPKEKGAFLAKELLSGNEAIARGAYEGGVRVAAGYPGTPSSEILENLALFDEIYAQWSPNEKVALEVGIGSSLGGARTLVAMKHVGLNVAADPLFTLSYTGVNAGLIVVSCDDPSLYSSQNEQDNRHYARAAKIPMLEPSDSQEAKDFTILGFEISEEFDAPVLLRSTTRVSHSKSIVEISDERKEIDLSYEKNPQKYVMVPGHAIKRHAFVEERLKRLAEYSDTSPLNKIERNSSEIGIITGGISYQYAKEIFPGASYLKLGMTYPLPRDMILSFASDIKTVYVIEELDPFLEEQIRAMGIKTFGKEVLPRVGELKPEILRDKLWEAGCWVAGERHKKASVDEAKNRKKEIAANLPLRPPVLCPGCPHRGVFYALKQLRLIVPGDIGCYTLAALPPLEAMDTCICMGAGIGTALGFEKASEKYKGRIAAVIGDSTFIHSGITPLIDIVYNKGCSTVIILDNRTTAMTGRQDHPGTGVTLKGKKTKTLDFAKLAKAIGIESVVEVDPYDLDETKKRIKEEVEKAEPSLIISSRPCLLVEKFSGPVLEVDLASCVDCGLCLRLACPAISKADEKIEIDPLLCTGCELCVKVCNLEAIKRTGGKA